MRRFDPQPAPGELPSAFPSPFAIPPHPLARRAAEEIMRELGEQREGKMFGVLVVVDRQGQVGYLRAFSGMLDGSWYAPGFAPPAFDMVARDAFWPAGERELAELDHQLAELDASASPRRRALEELDVRNAAELAALQARHRERRRARHETRALAGASHELDQQSRADAAERRRLDATHVESRAALAALVAGDEVERAALRARRVARSRELLHAIHATYTFANAGGERRAVRALFAPAEPPGGAGDCAAPKLLAQAYREGLRPLALAELWWGPPPATGGRHAGAFYPACRGKCGPILAHALGGLPAEPLAELGAARVPDAQPRTVFEDRWLVVVAKPVGLLSVPGRSGALRDSVLVRLRARYPDATGPLLVHRLDLDTSGLLLAAKDAATHAALQRLFALRELDKRYVAWLDGNVASEAGLIDLPVRVDVDDRPRQVVDPIHGKPALTSWRVLARDGARTRVELAPHTGRTHQLRVHAAHPRGLDAPIVGDRLYGRPGERLLLHAAVLAFVHPHTREHMCFEDPAPF
jgi:tRNA pseudouridine32 synthase/23S rRNA pseudouridine746 synthase